jgi:hypothetical protein
MQRHFAIIITSRTPRSLVALPVRTRAHVPARTLAQQISDSDMRAATVLHFKFGLILAACYELLLFSIYLVHQVSPSNGNDWAFIIVDMPYIVIFHLVDRIKSNAVQDNILFFSPMRPAGIISAALICGAAIWLLGAIIEGVLRIALLALRYAWSAVTAQRPFRGDRSRS